uniref:Immunoglobulin V-set domain-containing protein n=1 Tax=Cyprinodon variegatus TaxID=28743 RepID=A0A3Q2CPZ9_CYPVA
RYIYIYISITGIEGNPVTITCSHSYADTNIKYFCRDPCDNADVLIKSNGQQTEKYRIEDKGNTFYVTISNLEKKDAGIYWCGIERVGADTYNKVILTTPLALNLSPSRRQNLFHISPSLLLSVVAHFSLSLLYFNCGVMCLHTLQKYDCYGLHL